MVGGTRARTGTLRGMSGMSGMRSRAETMKHTGEPRTRQTERDMQLLSILNPRQQETTDLPHYFSKPKFGKFLGRERQQAIAAAYTEIMTTPPRRETDNQKIVNEINEIFNQIVSIFSSRVSIQYSVEQGHNEYSYYEGTLNHLKISNKFPFLLNTFFNAVYQLTNFGNILVIDGENKLNHNLEHIQQAIRSANIQNFVDYLITIFKKYTKIFIVCKTEEVDELSEAIIKAPDIEENKIVKLSFFRDGFYGPSSLDDLLVVYIVEYLKSISESRVVYNTNMGFGRHSPEAFGSSPKYITTFSGSTYPINPTTFYTTPHNLRELPQLSVATGDKYIFI